MKNDLLLDQNSVIVFYILPNTLKEGKNNVSWSQISDFFIYLFSHLADAFIQSDLQMRTL